MCRSIPLDTLSRTLSLSANYILAANNCNVPVVDARELQLQQRIGKVGVRARVHFPLDFPRLHRVLLVKSTRHYGISRTARKRWKMKRHAC